MCKQRRIEVNILSLLALFCLDMIVIGLLVSFGILSLFHIQILEQIGINIILAVGLNLIVGFSGQFSLGHTGFMAIRGAYAAAIIGSKSPTYSCILELCCLVLSLLVWLPWSLEFLPLRLKRGLPTVATCPGCRNYPYPNRPMVVI